ncbi:unnamed protein product [Ilex paraguariensis]|uniref:AT-hook motif nuclear-localized protein n=1 Tax=Ilex paraguariensis TaxID=185542 RepID=A0ABC8R065_9AQUA
MHCNSVSKIMAMEDRERTVSGSPGGNSERESPPPASGGGGGGWFMPEVMNIAVNTSIEGNLGVTTGGIVDGGGSGDLLGKKKRGRPRKYDADGNLTLSYMASGSPPPPPPGFSWKSPSSGLSSKRGRGRPQGSGNRQLLSSLGELFANTAGGDFTPHVVTVNTGEDVAAKIFSFAQKGPRGICILSANGAVSNLTIRQPSSSGGVLTYEGRFDILSLTGSFTISKNGGVKSRTGGLSVSLAGPDGQVIGGGIAGLLMAASPIQIVVGSFKPNSNKNKTHKRKHYLESTMAPMIPGGLDTVTVVKPISQAASDGSIFPIPTSQLRVQSHSTSTDAAGSNCFEPILNQRQYPDINVSVTLE